MAPLEATVLDYVVVDIDVVGADLEKAASGASGACGHFLGYQAILRTF